MAETTIAALLASAERGDPDAAQQLFAALYAELHRQARRELGRGNQLTLGATTLLHEAYLRIAAQDDVAFPDRGRFMAYASRVMRRLVIDHVRRRQAIKRGGQFELTALDTSVPDQHADGHHLERLSDALDELAGGDAAGRCDCHRPRGTSARDAAGRRLAHRRHRQRTRRSADPTRPVRRGRGPALDGSVGAERRSRPPGSRGRHEHRRLGDLQAARGNPRR